MHNTQKIINLFNEEPKHENVLKLEAKIAIHKDGGIHLLDFRDITHCEAMSNYTKIFTNKGKQFMLSKTLKLVEDNLPKGNFIRVHQSYLVAKDLIICIRPDQLHLSTGITIPISKSRKKEVLQKLLEGIVQL